MRLLRTIRGYETYLEPDGPQDLRVSPDAIFLTTPALGAGRIINEGAYVQLWVAVANDLTFKTSDADVTPAVGGKNNTVPAGKIWLLMSLGVGTDDSVTRSANVFFSNERTGQDIDIGFGQVPAGLGSVFGYAAMTGFLNVPLILPAGFSIGARLSAITAGKHGYITSYMIELPQDCPLPIF